jgi:hypothetical protein
MITHYEVPSFLRNEIPELKLNNYVSKPSLEIFISINNFTNCTKRAVAEHNYSLAKKCFSLADKLYAKGDRLVRMLIESNFVYSFSTSLSQSKVEGLLVNCIIPDHLYKIYLKQRIRSGVN